MRYFLVTYVKRPNGKLDEQTAVVRNLKRSDYQLRNIILDFRDMKVLSCHADGVTVPKNWDSIHNYFLLHYESIFRRLHEENGRQLIVEDELPAPAQVSE